MIDFKHVCLFPSVGRAPSFFRVKSDETELFIGLMTQCPDVWKLVVAGDQNEMIGYNCEYTKTDFIDMLNGVELLCWDTEDKCFRDEKGFRW